MPKVSVIVPAYNAEKYIANCIESVLMQSFDDLELIIVNDGSKDNTLSIIQKYKAKYDCIIVIDKPNSGVSDTRNTGINVSNGEYIIFLDSDDILLNDYIERHLSALSADVDLVISKLFDTNDEDNYYRVDTYDKLYLDRLIPWSFPFCKLFKSEIIKKHSIIFNTEMKLCEDWMFVMDYIRYANKIAIIDYIGYKWNTDNGASLSRGCTFEYRVYAYDVALKHLEEMHKYKGIEEPKFYEAIRMKNMRIAIKRMYYGDNEKISMRGKERRSRLSEYYSLYGCSLEKKLNSMGIYPVMIDLKYILKRDFVKVLSFFKHQFLDFLKKKSNN